MPASAPPATSQRSQPIYVLSDSTGNLAKHMLTAFLTQFPPDAFNVQTCLFLQNPDKLQQAFERISASPGIVLHALVAHDAKSAVTAFCKARKLPCKDLTGDFVSFLAHVSGHQPSQDYRKLHHVDDVYLRRISAVEFAMSHDDGLGLETLHEADLVLAGVSRTSKTPTTIYLSQQGWKVGNVALAIQVEPPRELLSLPARKVVGLIINPRQLAAIRTRRQAEWRMSGTSYNDEESVENELAWSRKLFARQGWPIIDVTNQAIEETAARIVEIAGLGRSTQA